MLPPYQTLTAPPDWACVDFISDLHLDASRPSTLKAWTCFLNATPAQAVFILGDLFEAWVGDDATQQDGFERQAAQALQEAARQRWIGFMPGNRDFLVGSALLEDMGVHAVADPTVLEAFGQRVLLSHGDQLCLADADYQRFRLQVRDPRWQASFLARPLVERRALAQTMRDASRQHQGEAAEWADVDPSCAQAWLIHSNCSVLIHGHTHRPGSQALSSKLVRHVLTDWELDDASPGRAQVLRFTAEGFARLNP